MSVDDKRTEHPDLSEIMEKLIEQVDDAIEGSGNPSAGLEALVRKYDI